MPRLVLAIILGLTSFLTSANPALTGQWSGTVQGQRVSITGDDKGGGNIDGVPMRSSCPDALFSSSGTHR